MEKSRLDPVSQGVSAFDWKRSQTWPDEVLSGDAGWNRPGRQV